MMEKAIVADARNPISKYFKANILANLGDYHKALRVLEELKDSAPQESSIHALLGKIYKQVKLYDKAVLNFGIALDLNPSTSDAVKIKVIYCLTYQSLSWLTSLDWDGNIFSFLFIVTTGLHGEVNCTRRVGDRGGFLESLCRYTMHIYTPDYYVSLYNPKVIFI